MKTLQQTCQITNTKNSKLFGALFMMLFIQSCLKEEYDKVEHKTNYYYLTAAQLNQTPYFTNPTFDTISFASDKGDTLTFVKTQTDTSWYCEQGSGNPNTGYDKDCYQTIHNTYATIKGNGSFDVKHVLKYSNIRNKIQIEFNSYLLGFGHIEIGNKSYINFLGDIIINGKSYSDCLYEINNDGSVKGYLNKYFGLISTKDTFNSISFFILNK